MKTLTITDAKKNLGRWLQSAGRGENVGIICGADIIALRKVEVTPVAETYAYSRRPQSGTTDEKPKGRPAKAAEGRRRKRVRRTQKRRSN